MPESPAQFGIPCSSPAPNNFCILYMMCRVFKVCRGEYIYIPKEESRKKFQAKCCRNRFCPLPLNPLHIAGNLCSGLELSLVQP